MLTAIVSAVVILGVLIIVHESGHFLMAKRLGVRVIRFSIGYPPRIFGLRRGETEYAIGATPFGGYVRMLGEEVSEDPRSEELATYIQELARDVVEAAREHGSVSRSGDFGSDLRSIAERIGTDAKPASAGAFLGRGLKREEALVLDAVRQGDSLDDAAKHLSSQPPPFLIESFNACAFPTQRLINRILIVVAGPVANLIFAPILLALIFMYGVPMLLPVIGEARTDLPAYLAGLRSGDRIVSVNGEPTASWGDFSDLVKASHGTSLHLEVERTQSGSVERRSVVLNPRQQMEKTIYGTMAPQWIIGVMPRGDQFVRRLGPFGAAKEATISTLVMADELVVGLAQIVSGATPVRQALGGPIMIAQEAGKEAHRGLASVVMFTVMLSIELGLINLLPVPLLDGGHLAFFVFEGVRGKPLELRYREMALQVGLFLLVALMAFVIFNDISRIVQG